MEALATERQRYHSDSCQTTADHVETIPVDSEPTSMLLVFRGQHMSAWLRSLGLREGGRTLRVDYLN